MDGLLRLRLDYPEWDCGITSVERTSGPPWAKYYARRESVTLLGCTVPQLRISIERADAVTFAQDV